MNSSKTLKICALVGGVMLTAGIVITMVSLEVNGKDRPAGTRDVSGESAQSVGTVVEQDVRNLDISAPGGELTIREGDKFSVELGPTIAKHVRYEVKDGTFRLWDPDNSGSKSWMKGNRWWNNQGRRNLDIILTIPADQEFDDVLISFGAGECDLSGLTAKRADISTGAGSIEASGMRVSESFVFDAGVGESDLEGDLTGEIEISGGVGETKLVLARPRTDYNITTSSGVGTVTVDGKEYSFLERDLDEDNGADNSIDVSCGVGEIEIQFQNGQF